jgi:L-2-hydroxyglutarate oxidase LhgO
LCVKGNSMLYDLCERHDIGNRRTGKMIVAFDHNEEDYLRELYEHAKDCGVPGISMISKNEIKKLEPDLNAVSAIYSSRTGIIDSHRLMSFLFQSSRENDCMAIFKSEVTGIEKKENGYILTINNDYQFHSDIVINCAGLYSDMIARMVGVDIDAMKYRIYPCKGEYYSINKKIGIRHLIYPVPNKNIVGLGVHLTIGLDGSYKLGPNSYYIDTIDYSIDDRFHGEFYESAKRILPDINYDDISPQMAGIRPKIQGPHDGVKDFVIRHEDTIGYKNFINCIGIESPGLTSSLAIAEYIEQLL